MKRSSMFLYFCKIQLNKNCTWFLSNFETVPELDTVFICAVVSQDESARPEDT